MLSFRRSLPFVTAAGFALLCSTSVWGANPAFYSGTGEYYQVIDTHATWQQARDAAAASTYLGVPGRLATINSAGEDTFITSILTGGNDSYWLGGYQDHSAPDYSEPAGGWRWITDEPFSAYTNWRTSTGEPNNDGGNADFLELLDTGNWNDLAANSGLSGGYIIEYAPVPEPSSVALLATGAGGLLLRRRRWRGRD